MTRQVDFWHRWLAIQFIFQYGNDVPQNMPKSRHVLRRRIPSSQPLGPSSMVLAKLLSVPVAIGTLIASRLSPILPASLSRGASTMVIESSKLNGKSVCIHRIRIEAALPA